MHLLRRRKSWKQAKILTNREIVDNCLRLVETRMRSVLATITLLLYQTSSAVQDSTLARDEEALEGGPYQSREL
jgi:hypothetical protein